ncbi:ABC transporter permease [Oscillibacter sp. MSJ-2]|uniref:ABC transporter permease n=1 Tax=Dysosmobacter acutus TaxID=2841504 RepID=A0ABS6F7S9_9FIRM|nr:ABC transporter permease [Dysosmobacter acutus]MBU5625359.1 ABC transporter permease [Dysosmobacter acutus]
MKKQSNRLLQRARYLARPTHYVAAVILIVIVLCALFAGALAPMDPLKQDLRNCLSAPSLANLFGTDQLGRDILSRVIYGSRVSLLVCLASVLFAGVLGVLIGVMAGYFGGALDLVTCAVTDTQMSIPFFVLALTLASIFDPSLWSVILILSITSWPRYARMARSQAITLRSMDYVRAAVSMGASPGWILMKHIVPNVMGIITTLATTEAARMILLESALSFIGMGVPADSSSWGLMTSDGRAVLATAWWVATIPGLAIFITCASITILGDFMRRVLKME